MISACGFILHQGGECSVEILRDPNCHRLHLDFQGFAGGVPLPDRNFLKRV
jgi:hypothetical protein